MRPALPALLCLTLLCLSCAHPAATPPAPARNYEVGAKLLGGKLKCDDPNPLAANSMKVLMAVSIAPEDNDLALIAVRVGLLQDGELVDHLHWKVPVGKYGYAVLSNGAEGFKGVPSVEATFEGDVAARCAKDAGTAVELAVDGTYTFADLEGNLGNMALDNRVKQEMALLLTTVRQARYAYKKRIPVSGEEKWTYPHAGDGLPVARQDLD